MCCSVAFCNQSSDVRSRTSGNEQSQNEQYSTTAADDRNTLEERTAYCQMWNVDLFVSVVDADAYADVYVYV